MLATASALALGPGGADAQDAPAKDVVLPRRPLGKTGVDITLLDIGTGKGKGIDRILRYAFARGIRAFDTSETYGSEVDFKHWFEAVPAVRKEVFLVTKDTPKTPSELPAMLDKRLRALGTDYVDLIFIHSFGDNHPPGRRRRHAQGRGVPADGRGDQEVGQGPARGHLDPPQGPRRAAPGRRRRRDR